MSPRNSITEQLVAQLGQTPDPRLRDVMIALVRNLHQFAVDAALTQQEWAAGIEFLTATGHMCDSDRQEFILLSDVMGLSSLVEQIDNQDRRSTESTVLGPFYREHSPHRQVGEAIFERPSGIPTQYSGRVLDADGDPIAGATIDVWQNGADQLYAAQVPGALVNNLRGVFTTDEQGRYRFLGVRPVDYPVPTDGPVGTLLKATSRDEWRAAHIHAIVRADGYRPVTTHLFDDASAHLDSDVVFGVKDSLIKHFTHHRWGGDAPVGVPSGSDWYSVEHDFVLEGAQ